MEKIVEIYPSAEEVKEQVEYRKTFGWKSSIELTSRGVFEVTFTIDLSTAKNKKLKELEEEFMECSVAEDYIERYNTVHVDKKKFKAFHPAMLLLVLYLLFILFVQGVALVAVSEIYKTDPDLILSSLTIQGEGGKQSIDKDWSQELNLEEMGVYGIASLFGIKDKIFVLTVDGIMQLFVIVGIGSLALFIILLIWTIKKTIRAKTYYKAELAYVQNRKDILNEMVDELDTRMDEIIAQTAKA